MNKVLTVRHVLPELPDCQNLPETEFWHIKLFDSKYLDLPDFKNTLWRIKSLRTNDLDLPELASLKGGSCFLAGHPPVGLGIARETTKRSTES